jgi:hypothetical protein
MANYRTARAAGGYKMHAVLNGTSACGHTPTNSPTNQMRDRARWIYYTCAVNCAKCLKQIAKEEEL